MTGDTVASRPETSASDNEWAAYLRKQLPAFMIPRAFLVLPLPPSPNGKVDRDGLPEPSSPEHCVEATEESQALEDVVRRVWRDLLESPIVDNDANFFDLGGTSIMTPRPVSG